MVPSTAPSSGASATSSPATGLPAPPVDGVGRGAEACWSVPKHLHALVKRRDLREQIVDAKSKVESLHVFAVSISDGPAYKPEGSLA